MNNELEQIKVSFETLGMSPEDIAADRELDLASVKAALLQCSPKFRKLSNQAPETDEHLNFSDDDLVAVNKVIKEIALGSEDDNLRLKAAIYIRDDKRGRKDVQKAVGGMGINILQFNQYMQKARQMSDGLRGALNGGTVDV